MSQFKDFDRNLHFGDFVSIDFRKITVDPKTYGTIAISKHFQGQIVNIFDISMIIFFYIISEEGGGLYFKSIWLCCHGNLNHLLS